MYTLQVLPTNHLQETDYAQYICFNLEQSVNLGNQVYLCMRGVVTSQNNNRFANHMPVFSWQT